MVKSTYNSIKVLSEIEHIQQRPGMYIGETENPTHLFHEVFDNSLDEAVSGHATKIDIVLNKDSFTLRDNGRGIPQNWNEEFKTYEPVLVAMKLHSGGKFDKEAYQIAIGLHGIGLVACNALSDQMTIETQRDKSKFFVEFNNALPNNPKIEKVTDKSSYTSVYVHPSPKFFVSTEFDKVAVESRLRLAVTFVPNLVITLNDIVVKPYETKELCRNSSTDIFISIFEDGKESIQVYYGYNLSAQNRDVNNGSVNLLEVNYGSHIRIFERAIKDAWLNIFDPEMKKFLNEDDCLCGVRGFTFVKLMNPSYTSQTKDTLAGSVKNYTTLLNGLSKSIQKDLLSNPKIVAALITKFKDYRTSLNKLSSSEYLNSVIEYGADETIDRSVILDSKLIDCTSNDRVGTELYIVEGDSAGGGIIPLRDPRVHAILPLRGKVMNVVDCDIKHILDNLEVRSLVNAIGAGCLHKEDVSKIRYEKIIISCDADEDGKNISALLLGALCYLVPGVVKAGKVYISETPLWGNYKSRPKDEFVPIFHQKDINPNWKTVRFKGLGSMDPEELCKSLLNPEFRRLRHVEVIDISDVTKIVGDSAYRKKMLVRKHLVEK